MLPPYIIEEIRKRENDRDDVRPQPRLDLPLPPPPSRADNKPTDDSDRGHVVIDLM